MRVEGVEIQTLSMNETGYSGGTVVAKGLHFNPTATSDKP